MKIIFIGYAVPEASNARYSGLSVAGNKMQNGILASLKYADVNLEIISIRPIASYPKDRIIFLRKNIITFGPDLSGTGVCFINFPIIKQISQVAAVTFEIIKKSQNGDIILTFNAFPQTGLPALLIKLIKDVRFIPLLADLPIDDAVGRKGLSLALRKIFDSTTRKILKYCDKALVLNKKAAEIFIPGKKFLAFGGGITKNDLNRYCSLSIEIKNVVYTGALTKYSGIKELIESMLYVEANDIFLDIYGAGQLEDYIKEISAKNPRIRFYGKIEPEKILDVQSRSWLLANPRNPSDPIADVTFPSKIFEYLSSGRPVISTRLSCFGDEYENIIFFTKDSDPKNIAESINQVAKLSEQDMRLMAMNAYLFVQNKTWEAQAQKIIDFIAG